MRMKREWLLAPDHEVNGGIYHCVSRVEVCIEGPVNCMLNDRGKTICVTTVNMDGMWVAHPEKALPVFLGKVGKPYNDIRYRTTISK